MTTNLNERAREIIAETLPLMEQHRAPMEAALERYMARQGPYDTSAGRSRVTTGAIAGMLFDHARAFGGKDVPVSLTETAQRHRKLSLGGEHYSTFGDALKPIMKDVLESKATSPVLAAWTDAYWAIVRMLFRQETRLAA